MRIALAAFIAALSLAACGGGSSSTNVPTLTPPTTAPQTHSLSVAWSGAEHSRGTVTSSLLRLPMALASVEPVAIGATEQSCGSCLTIGDNGEASATNTATIIVQQVNATGTPSPVSSPIVTSSTTLVTTSAPTNTTTQTNIPIQSTTQPAQGVITVTASDGTSTSISVQSLPNIALGASSNPGVFQDAHPGYVVDSAGIPQPTNDTTKADLYVQLSSGSTPTSLILPYGYENISLGGIGISEVTAAPLTFTSQGTSIPYAKFTDVSNPYTFLLVKTANGKYLYLALTRAGAYGDAPLYAMGAGFYGSYKVF